MKACVCTHLLLTGSSMPPSCSSCEQGRRAVIVSSGNRFIIPPAHLASPPLLPAVLLVIKVRHGTFASSERSVKPLGLPQRLSALLGSARRRAPAARSASESPGFRVSLLPSHSASESLGFRVARLPSHSAPRHRCLLARPSQTGSLHTGRPLPAGLGTAGPTRTATLGQVGSGWAGA